MEPTQDPLSHTTQGRNYTTSMPSRISTALFQDPALVWGSGVGRESHIPAEGRKPKRGDGWCCRGFQLALTDIPGVFTGQDNRQATETLLYDNGKCHVHFRTKRSYTFAFFVQFYHENCFNHLLQKELAFFYARADSRCDCESLQFFQILYFLKKKSNFD